MRLSVTFIEDNCFVYYFGYYLKQTYGIAEKLVKVLTIMPPENQ